MIDRARRLSFAIVVLAVACASGAAVPWVPGALIACVPGALIACVPGTTRAHLGHLSLRAERYLKLDVRNDYVRAVMSLQLEGPESLRAREHVDANHDGTMTAAEVRDSLEEWREQLRRELSFRIDGRPAAARWDEGVIVPLGPVRTLSTTVELVTRVPLPPGARARIELRDALTFAGLQSTELRLEASDGMRLEVADIAPGHDVTPRMTLAEVSSTARPRTIVVVAKRASSPSSGGPASTPGAWSPIVSFGVFFGLVAAAGLIATVMIVRRRRARIASIK